MIIKENSMNSKNRGDLSAFFEPAAVAVIGSMREVPGTARWIIRNMRHFGFSGSIFPINPNPSNYGDVYGLTVHPSITQIDEAIDLAAIITPPPTVPEIVEQCVEKGVKAAVVLSEGFAESGSDGARLQQQLADIAHRSGIRIMGPNTFGVVNAYNGLATIPPFTDNESIERGGVAFCSQTGSIGPHQMPLHDWAYPISKICDIGNKCDVDEADIINYLADDDETKVVAMHLEDVKDGIRFLGAARKMAALKPLVILKAGRSEAGGKASASHTGSLLGNDRVYEAALKQVGAIRVDTWQELWDVPKTLYYQPLPNGNRFAIITFTGGQGVIAADAATNAGLEVASFTKNTVRRLRKASPRLGNNPVDIGPVMSDSRSQSSSNPFSIMEEAIPVILEDPNVDCLTITFSVGQQMTAIFPVIVDMLDKSTRGSVKTTNVWIYGTSYPAMQELARQLQTRSLPSYLDLDLAVKSHGAASHYSRIRADHV